MVFRVYENGDEGEGWQKHYCSSHEILLVGEGDFSFSACLAEAFGSATNMFATSLDSSGMPHHELVRGFLRCAKYMLFANGEHVTQKTTYSFNLWMTEQLAEDVGLRLLKEVTFNRKDYPGYVNKRGAGAKFDRTFRVGKSSTFKFGLFHPRTGTVGISSIDPDQEEEEFLRNLETHKIYRCQRKFDKELCSDLNNNYHQSRRRRFYRKYID
ncbi:hypothetical protein Ancab_019802 [Ancistrocladus abbreviatus]